MTAVAPTVQSSIAEVWYLKSITFGFGESKKQYKIITQNFNGSVIFLVLEAPGLIS
jgi:ubiquitin carboxyl-terminal hydrolase MINDY-1/2